MTCGARASCGKLASASSVWQADGELYLLRTSGMITSGLGHTYPVETKERTHAPSFSFAHSRSIRYARWWS